MIQHSLNEPDRLTLSVIFRFPIFKHQVLEYGNVTLSIAALLVGAEGPGCSYEYEIDIFAGAL
jgi:hypothetical protein